MTAKLDADVILRLLREERDKQLRELRESLDVVVDLDGEQKKIVAPGLKLRSHDGTLFTVKAVGPDSVMLISPEGETIHVDDSELEKEYDID